ncbi:PRD domain protein, EF_0829/AHA_3910 family [Citrobacter koseri]|uniref:PRD domain protein, EF_0829/AHA_3910 family n=1 Tax=Citrobacter koseri TaxID=545 RepID=A0A2X2VAZ0_CITKO|nr:PRD domain protein, EF_0829/AHA_3910 family [Citrobacter koseri]
MNDMGEQVTEIGELADRMLAQVYALLSEHHIIPNAVQEQMLTSHVRAMAHRSGDRRAFCRKWMPVYLMKFQPNQWRLPATSWRRLATFQRKKPGCCQYIFEVAKDNL